MKDLKTFHFTSSMPVIGVGLFFAATLGASVSLAAQQTKPGDVLYPFKISVTERLLEAVTPGEANIALHIRAMGTRLDEARQLAALGRLDTAKQAQLLENFTTHAEAVTSHIQTLQTTGQQTQAIELAATFHATLVQQTATLVDVGIKSTPQVQHSLSAILAGAQKTLTAAAANSLQVSALK